MHYLLDVQVLLVSGEFSKTGLSRRLWNRAQFQVVSDLHLEVGKQYASFNVPARADRLILAGDMGRLEDYEPFCDFLKSTWENFVQVFFVLGNHEFFGLSWQQGLELAERMEQKPGLQGILIIMNRKRVDLDDHGIPATILGCTLQSYVPPAARGIVQQKVNDFRRTVDWTAEDHCEEHTMDVTWLSKEVHSTRHARDGACRKILVVTHHAPSTTGTSDPAHQGNAWSSVFGTDLLRAENRKRSGLDTVQAWVFGHTHYCTDTMSGGVGLLASQRGYVIPRKVENTSTGFLQATVQKLRWNGEAK